MGNIVRISNLDASELDFYSRYSEVQLLHYYEPKEGIFIAESPKVITRALDAGCVPISLLMEEGQTGGETKEILERCAQVPVYTARAEVLTKLTGFALTRGMLCAMYRPVLPSIEKICEGARRLVILENVVNPTNVGAIFRSAAALGMDGVLLTAGCSDPLYRRSCRVSMGTVFQIPWTKISKELLWPKNVMDKLHSLGFVTAAMALSNESISLTEERLMSEEKLAIVLGTEGEGLLTTTIADCDYTVKIPMSHGVDSLNVAAASAVAFWQLGRRF